MSNDDAPFSQKALNVIWVRTPGLGYSFDDWIHDQYENGTNWDEIVELVAELTVEPGIAPDGLKRTRQAISGWYPHLRRSVPSEYARTTEAGAA